MQVLGSKSGLVVGILNSQMEGHGFESHPILDGIGVKAMPGSISAPNPGSFNDWKERKYTQKNNFKNRYERFKRTIVTTSCSETKSQRTPRF